MAQIVEVEPGDMLVFANCGDLPTGTLESMTDRMAEWSGRLGTNFVVCTGPCDVSVVRRALLEGDPDDEGGEA